MAGRGRPSIERSLLMPLEEARRSLRPAACCLKSGLSSRAVMSSSATLRVAN